MPWFLKLFTYVTIITVFYLEIVTYTILPLQWQKLPTCKPPKCIKLLLVADPQIIGWHTNGHSVKNFLAKWDSDRYIRKTFLQVFDFTRPNIVIFLGDVMDEGHISTDEEFMSYSQRFFQIFDFSHISNSHTIILPGDNDIGGIDDVMLPQVVERFNQKFIQSKGPVLLGNLQFYKVNFMTYEIQEPNYTIRSETNSKIRIVLTHVPLLSNPTLFLKKVVRRVRPHLIFSGHLHFSSHYVAAEADIWKRKYDLILPSNIKGRTYSLGSGLIHEIVVPTCSYRMGARDMGYGVAFIDTQTKVLHYNVLWLPRRFIQLSILAVIILTFSLVLFFLCIHKFTHRTFPPCHLL